MSDGVVKGIRVFRDKMRKKKQGYSAKAEEMRKEIMAKIQTVVPKDWFSSTERNAMAKKHGSDNLSAFEAEDFVKAYLAPYTKYWGK